MTMTKERVEKCREFLLYMGREGNLAEQEYAADLLALLEEAQIKAGATLTGGADPNMSAAGSSPVLGTPTPGLPDADERERFEKWWTGKMGDSMKGSKYLARNAWLAARWDYGSRLAQPKPTVTFDEFCRYVDELRALPHAADVVLAIFLRQLGITIEEEK